MRGRERNSPSRFFSKKKKTLPLDGDGYIYIYIYIYCCGGGGVGFDKTMRVALRTS